MGPVHQALSTGLGWVWGTAVREGPGGVPGGSAHPPPHIPPTAQLLRQGHHRGVAEEDRHLLEAAHQCQRGDHLRLQVPHRGCQDPLPLRLRELPGDPQLGPVPGDVSCPRRPSVDPWPRGQTPPPTPISGAVPLPSSRARAWRPQHYPQDPPQLRPLSGKGLLCLSAHVSFIFLKKCSFRDFGFRCKCLPPPPYLPGVSPSSTSFSLSSLSSLPFPVSLFP